MPATRTPCVRLLEAVGKACPTAVTSSFEKSLRQCHMRTGSGVPAHHTFCRSQMPFSCKCCFRLMANAISLLFNFSQLHASKRQSSARRAVGVTEIECDRLIGSGLSALWDRIRHNLIARVSSMQGVRHGRSPKRASLAG
eukprot:6194519-Pleurochrysis_carterae.AAC.2